MLDACNSCGFEAAPPSDFERLNNAIVRAASRGGAFAKLNEGWQDEVVEERNWKMAIPPLWSSLLESYWIQYGKLYRTAAPGLVNPYDVAPTGISGALRDLYRPTTQVAEQAQQKAEQTLKEAQAAATAKIQSALKAAGKAAAAGAAEETQKQAVHWGVWAAGAAVLAAAGYLAMRTRRGGFAGIGDRAWDAAFTKCYEKNKLTMGNKALARHCNKVAYAAAS